MHHIGRKIVRSVGSGLRTIALRIAVVTVAACAALPAMGASGSFVLHNTPSYVTTAKNLGPENLSKTIEVSLWLNPHNRAELDAVTNDLYNPASPNYRHFLTRAEFAARYAPTAAEAQTVRRFLEAHNLKVLRVGPSNFFVRARGTVGQIEQAFSVQLNQYKLMNKVIRANDHDPFIDDGAAASLVRAIEGLDSAQAEHPFRARPTSVAQAMGAKTGAAVMAATATTATTSSAPPFSNECFIGTETDVFSTNANGSFPIGTYKGNHLNLPSQTSVGCGYTPPMIQAAYNLNALYAAGFSGQGQTIGIIDSCGTPSIEIDANTFSAAFGLPPLTPSNFTITNIPSTAGTCAFDGNIEVNIDVEWAHAIAPGANINLLIAPSSLFVDLDEVEFTAINNGLATVISGSYGFPEPFLPTSLLETINLISEIGAATGISTNFSTGDNGDFSEFGLPQVVSAPASSPFATAVGGISLALNSDNSIKWQQGWGDNIVAIANDGTVFDPPFAAGLDGGSGGGASNCVQQSFNSTHTIETCLAGFPKPAFQKKLPGTTRQIPDVAWLADLFTGAVVAFTQPGVFPPQIYQVFGGTSVSCPMFSALWAIANQVAGKPLGQAAPYLYSLPAGAILDVVPFGPQHNNVTASIRESATVTKTFSPAQVLGGAVSGNFISGIWDDPFIFNAGVVISFGQDCIANPTLNPAFDVLCNSPNRLRTKVGWDNVTGMGVPNGPAFVNAFAPPPPPAP